MQANAVSGTWEVELIKIETEAKPITSLIALFH